MTVIGLLLWHLIAEAQCTNAAWQQTDGLRGFDGTVYTTIVWDRDGPGGQPPVLVAGGNFAIAGTTFAQSIAVWNGIAWEALGSGVSGDVYSLVVDKNGDLIAGGSFRDASGVVANGIARWNGVSWSAFGSGMSGIGTVTIYALEILNNGDVVAGGYFNFAGGVTSPGIARWDGNAWNALGAGLGGATIADIPIVMALKVLPNGDLIATGTFIAAGGATVSNIARWNGSQWSPIGSGLANSGESLALLPGGDLIVGGVGVWRWNGLSWTQLRSTSPGVILNAGGGRALAVLPNGDPVAGGAGSAVFGGPPVYVARWTGSDWVPVGTGTENSVNTLAVLPSGDLVAGGYFLAAGEVHASHIARWDGNSWTFFGTGMGENRQPAFPGSINIYALTQMPNGDVVAGGAFNAAGDITVSNIARWNGTKWSPLGSGTRGDVRAFAVATNGDLIVGGAFTNAGGVTCSGIARWNGNQWSSLGAGVAGIGTAIVYALAIQADGSIIAGGSFMSAGGAPAQRIARWDGSAWSPLGTGMNGDVNALLLLPSGDLIAGGGFLTAGGSSASRIARWDGSVWTAFGAGVSSDVYALALLPNQDIVAGGRFTTAAGVVTGPVAKWDGGQWSGVGGRVQGNVTSLAMLAKGDLVAAGQFTRAGTNTTSNVASWNGADWTTFGSGTGSTTVGFNAVNALAALTDGGFVMGGSFTHVSGVVARCFARWGCPAVSDRPLLTDVIMGSGGLRFSFSGAAGKTYSIQYSQGLQNWQTIQTGLQGTVNFEDTDSARRANPEGFYQVVVE